MEEQEARDIHVSKAVRDAAIASILNGENNFSTCKQGTGEVLKAKPEFVKFCLAQKLAKSEPVVRLTISRLNTELKSKLKTFVAPHVGAGNAVKVPVLGADQRVGVTQEELSDLLDKFGLNLPLDAAQRDAALHGTASLLGWALEQMHPRPVDVPTQLKKWRNCVANCCWTTFLNMTMSFVHDFNADRRQRRMKNLRGTLTHECKRYGFIAWGAAFSRQAVAAAASSGEASSMEDAKVEKADVVGSKRTGRDAGTPNRDKQLSKRRVVQASSMVAASSSRPSGTSGAGPVHHARAPLTAAV